MIGRSFTTKECGFVRIAIRTLIATFLPLVVATQTATAIQIDQPHQTSQALHRALDVARDGQWDEAEETIAATNVPELIEFFRWKRLLEADEDLEIEDYLDYLETAPDWPAIDTIRANAERLFDGGTSPSIRLEYFAANQPRTPEGRLSHLQALTAAGKEDRAHELVRSIWREENISVLDERRLLRNFLDELTTSDHIARLDRLLWERQHSAARRMFGLVGQDQQRLAEARIKLRRQDRGVDWAVAAVPGHLRNHPGLIYERSRWRRLKGFVPEARELLFASDDPGYGKRLFWRERNWHIRDRIDVGDFPTAYKLAAGHGQSAGLPFAEAEWLAGWIALRFLDQPEQAAAHFEALHDNVRSPISLSRGAYWRGRAALVMAEDDAARAWFDKAAAHPTTFYGQQALVELGDEIALPAKMPWIENATDPASSSAALDVADLVCGLGAANEATGFALHHLANHPEPDQAISGLARMANQCGRPDLLAGSVRRLASSGNLPYLASFPVPAMTQLLADHDVVSPALALVITRQESLFNSSARSHSNALGLMQIIPPTGNAVAKSLGETADGNRLLVDSVFNVRIGRTYLERLLDRFDGNTALAVASYNAGPNRVRQWLRVFGPFEGDDPHGWLDWIERIPFNETRNYVQRVMEGITVYEAMLERFPEGNISFAPDAGPIWPPPRPRLRPGSTA
ncbi:MAG: lytic transglycosylase domain-containing protein [Pseudomonadota bacterium]